MGVFVDTVIRVKEKRQWVKTPTHFLLFLFRVYFWADVCNGGERLVEV